MANSHTLGRCFTPRMRRADIEVPNSFVDMSSWKLLACYPRRNFYPLSDSPPTWNYRITFTHFRACSTCRSHSQAGLCEYTFSPISIRTKPTIARLRYSLGGDRPSQTPHQTLSTYRITASVRIFICQGWYLKVGSTITSVTASKPPTYPEHNR